jgi:hypothetical protein
MVASMIGHVAGGGVVSDALYLAIPFIVVGLIIFGESRKWAYASLVVGVALLTVGGIDAFRTRPKSSAGITLQVISPKSGDVFVANQVIEVKVNVKGITLTPIGQAANRPGEGHLHTYVDGNLYAMWGQPSDDSLKLSVGSHQVRVELTSNDHRPLAPAVEQTLVLTAR